MGYKDGRTLPNMPTFNDISPRLGRGYPPDHRDHQKAELDCVDRREKAKDLDLGRLDADLFMSLAKSRVDRTVVTRVRPTPRALPFTASCRRWSSVSWSRSHMSSAA